MSWDNLRFFFFTHSDIFLAMIKEFTATTYIIENNRILLILHKKVNKWLPPGGHLEPNETPPEGAKREAFEETGYHVEIIKQENTWIERWNASSFERPYHCLLEEIPAYGNMPAHQHIDFLYVATLAGGEILHNAEETHDIRWFTLDEVNALEDDVEIYVETKTIINKVMSDFYEYALPITHS